MEHRNGNDKEFRESDQEDSQFPETEVPVESENYFGEDEMSDEEGAVDQEQSKKSKKFRAGPNPPPQLPPDIKNLIQEKSMGQKAILVIQQRLSDVFDQQIGNRFFIPSGIKFTLFNNNELDELRTKNALAVTLMDPLIKGDSANMVLKGRAITPNVVRGREPIISFVLNGDWKRIVTAKNLEKDDIVQLWAVRVDQNLCFLLVRLPREGEGDGSSAGNSSLAGANGTETRISSSALKVVIVLKQEYHHHHHHHHHHQLNNEDG